MRGNTRRSTAAGAVAIALWAVLAVLSRAASGVPPLQLTAMAFAVSGAGGLAWLALRGRLSDLRQPPLAWVHGVGGLFGYHALYFLALSRAPAAEANLINYTWPLLIVLFSALLLGLRLRPAHLLGVALGFGGCLLLLGRGTGDAAAAPGAWVGYAAAVGCALTWSLYSVLARRFASVPTTAVAGFCAATALLAGTAHVVTEASVAPTAIGWLAVLLLGIGPVGAAFFLWDAGMKRGDPRLLGTLAYATPVASTLLLCLAGQAPFSAATVLAALLVAAGGVLASRAGAPVATGLDASGA
jgi:drug/metabolite transporter (DMT)-like permease